jgi:23S rRNA (guanine745-N1)-methyltransferase
MTAGMCVGLTATRQTCSRLRVMVDRPGFRCPHCALAMTSDSSGAWCPNGHRFDRAAEGYLHLLPAGRKKGAIPGDSAEMIRARRELFDQGHYAPIMAAVAEACSGRERVLDAGCGEGAYLAAVDAPVRLGIDVSKPAVKLAARRYRDIEFAVASSYRLPFDDGLFDAVVSVFAPRPFSEFSRVLRTGGVIVTASPGPEHLAGLRQYLYRDAKPHDERPHVAEDGEHSPRSRTRVRFELSLTGPDARSLLQMTPYWWSATAEQQQAVGDLTTTVDVYVAVHDPMH